MRWLLIWLLLTATWAAGWLVVRWAVGGGWELDRETLALLVTVPAAQVAALRAISAFRRISR
jgi:hypothetical protein